MAGQKRGPKPKDRAASTPLEGKPDAHRHLDKVAKEQWKRVADLVDKAGLLSRLDTFALEQYVSLYSTWREAIDKVNAQGKVIVAPNGYSQQNPWYTIAVQCAKDMKWHLDRFGLNPVARAKLVIAEPDQVDPKWVDFQD
jgi:P27 family predicted phage terminase small subunit